MCWGKTLSLALINVIWHISETGWVDSVLRFGPFYTSPSSSASHWFSQLTVWHWILFLSPDFTHSLYFYLHRLSASQNATTDTAALIRNQLPHPRDPRAPAEEAAGCHLDSAPALDGDPGAPSASCWSALICWEFSGKVNGKLRSYFFNMTWPKCDLWQAEMKKLWCNIIIFITLTALSISIILFNLIIKKHAKVWINKWYSADLTQWLGAQTTAASRNLVPMDSSIW